MFVLSYQHIVLRGFTVTWQGKVSGWVGAALGHFQYRWLVENRVIASQCGPAPADAARERGCFVCHFCSLDLFGDHCINFSVSCGRSQGTSLHGWEGNTRPSVPEGSTLLERVISSSSLETLLGLWRLWCVISAGQAFWNLWAPADDLHCTCLIFTESVPNSMCSNAF